MCQGHLLINRLEKETLSKIRKYNDLDEEVIKALKEMKEKRNKSIKGDEWIEEQGLILFKRKVYVPRDEELRKKMMCLYYNIFILGHPRCWKILELVMRNYWWLGISKYVLNYMDGCNVYQRKKTFTKIPARKLMLNPISNAPWMDISMDFITGLSKMQGYNAILVICN